MSQKLKQDEIILLGKNIRDLRMEKDITQEQMTARLQVRGIPISRTSYAKIEIGTRHVETSCLEAIKDILGTTYERLMAHTGDAES